ncbi:MAG: insulinase family protein [Planctomycetes bacterium]|nr:insulinase family protein [Planctomycetota bacterium]
MSNIQQHLFANGLVLITESISGVNTAALNWGVRAGVAYNACDGDSVLLAELVQRGALGLTAKEHNDELDMLGIKRQVSCGVEFFRVSGIMLGSHIMQGIPLLGGYLLQPKLPESDLAACKSLVQQSIQSLQDSPAHLAAVALNRHHLTSPFNRSAYGNSDQVNSATIESVRGVYGQLFTPKDSILGVAGDVNHAQVVELVEKMTSSWKTSSNTVVEGGSTDRGVHWIEQDSSQVHLGFAFDAPNASDSNAIVESVAISVFGGATSGRLFTHVRQRKSLCYSVSAQFAPSRERSVVRMHAGTTPERAEETIRICIEQLYEMRNGITKDEFSRTIQRLKSRTVMRGESTSARTNTLWGDQYAIGNTKSLADRLQELDDVTHESVNEWLKNRDFGALTLVYLGPDEIPIDGDLLVL